MASHGLSIDRYEKITLPPDELHRLKTVGGCSSWLNRVLKRRKAFSDLNNEESTGIVIEKQ
jgi:hypothetical protein